ncbi:MAG TPA: AsmA family protein [Candidatus Limnocylindria bacterium]|nr:AsmA family protein [Candidatus Limnocylindria bacterium]
MKKPLIIVAVVVVLLLVVILALPLLIDVNKYKPELQSTLGTALGRQVDVGNIKLAIFSGGVAIDDLAISDDPAFSRSPFLKAKQLTVGVNLIPLIFSKKLEVRSFGVVDPEVSLWRNSAGVWNYSSLGGSTSKTASKSKGDDPSSTNVTVEKLTISNGKITVGTVGSKAKPLVYQDVNVEASNLSTTAQFPFEFSAKDPGNGAVKVDGKAGPINQTDTSLTPLNAKIEVQHMDLGASGGLAGTSSGLGGLLDFNGTLNSDGHQLTSKGTVKTSKLKVAANGAPSTVPVNVDYDTEYDLKKQSGTLKQGDIHVGKALARLTGAFNIAGEEATLQMKLKGQAMPVSDLEGALPAVGVALPSGAKLAGGTLDTDLAISGPVNRLVIVGPVNLSNGKLAGYNLKSKLGALGSFAGLGGGSGSDTEIQTLSANLRQDSEGTHAQNLLIVVPSIGTITGDGNVSASGQLNCKMVAKLSGGGGAMGAVGQISKLGGSQSGGGIPFKIEGTTSNPIFVPDVAGMAGGLAKSQLGGLTSGGGNSAESQAVGALGGLLGGKKKKP